MIPKKVDAVSPSDYRLNTCPLTLYKCLTAIVYVLIYKYCEKSNVLSEPIIDLRSLRHVRSVLVSSNFRITLCKHGAQILNAPFAG